MFDIAHNQEIQIHKPKSPELGFHNKVLRIPERFGSASRRGKDVLGVLEPGIAELEDATIRVFEKFGYKIVRGGNFDADNPNEVGFYSNFGKSKRNALEANHQYAKDAGTRMPNELRYSEVIDSPEPIVAKSIHSDRGELKYLLETKEQKTRFLTWLLSLQQKKGISDSSLEETRKLIVNKDFSKLTSLDNLEDWYFEEYIRTPSDRYTSFRIVADAFGKVHYSALYYSDERKDEKHLVTKKHALDNLPILEAANLPGFEHRLLLEDPSSPLFLNSKFILSNRGDKSIPLGGQPPQALLQYQKDILKAHKLDPANPKLPQFVLDIASKMGKSARGDSPFVGIDFILQDGNGLFFLEANNLPDLEKPGVGMPEYADVFDTQIIMLRNVLRERDKQLGLKPSM